MNCLSENLIQAYIDNEGTSEERRLIMQHLATCEACYGLFEQLQEADESCKIPLENYKKETEKLQVPLAPVIPVKKNNKPVKGVNTYMKSYKKGLVAVCILGVLVAGMTIEPVRAAVGDVVSIFRATNIKTVDVSLGDLKKLETEISEHKGEINIDNLAQIKQTGGERKEISADAMKTAVDFPATPLNGFKDKIPTSTSVTTPLKVEFTLKIDNVNSLMTTLGATKLFDKSLDGKTFSILMPETITTEYRLNEKDDQIQYTQTKLPSIYAPEGTNLEELVSAISSLGILPSDIQSKLKSMTDLDKTLYLPNVDNEITPIKINGFDVYARFDKGEDYKYGTAMWLDNGILKILNGCFDQAELEEFIKGAK